MIPLTEGIEQQVFKLVPTQSLNALSATNRQFRQLVRMYTSQLKVRRRQDMLQSANHSWPRLATLDVSCANLNATSISALLVGQMPLLQHLNLSHNKLKPAAIQQLVQGNWPSLSTLNLASTFGGNHVPEHDIVASCQYLATANWLQLTEIDVSGNSLPSTAVAELAKARWPALQSISISGGTHGPFIKHLAEASWTGLRALELHCSRFGTDNAQSLQQPRWSQLTRLNLRCCLNFNPEEGDLAMSIQLIAAGHWPQLAVLDISSNSMKAQHMAALAEGVWPALTALDVSCNSGPLTAQLVEAPWTALQQLSLNVYSREDISALYKSDWPHLTRLELGTMFDVRPLQRLREQKWPQLAHLGLQCMSSQLKVLLPTCAPSLRTLWLSCISDCPMERAHMPRPESWPIDTRLGLTVTMDAAVLDSLAMGHWPVRTFCLYGNPSTPSLALPFFMKMDLTSMTNLSLQQTWYSQAEAVEGIQILATGSWPMLKMLDLAELCFNDECAAKLACGQWPSLEVISLRDNPELSLHGMQQLANGNWPMLCQLDVSLHARQRVLSKSTIAMLVQSFKSPFVRVITGNTDEWGREFHELSDEDKGF